MTETRPLRAYAEVALGRQRSPEHDNGPHMTPYLRAANVKDGALDLSDVKEMNFTPAEQQLYALRPGDVLVTEGSGSLSAVGASAVWSGELKGIVCFQNTLLRLRPRVTTDPRFLGWWCRYAFADRLFASISTGANIFHVSADRVRGLPLTYVPLDQQRAIVDFLDAETVRFDTLIAKKRTLMSRIDEHTDALAEQIIWRTVSRTVPLMHRTQVGRPIMYGIVLPGSDVPDGVPIVKGGDVAAARLLPEELCRTTTEIEAPYARARLRANDLVFAIRGGVGDVRIVPSELTGANITQDVARVAPGPDVDPIWLESVLRTRSVRAQVAQRTTGATIRGLNIWDLKRLCIPWSDEARQRQDMRALAPALERRRRLNERLRRQIALLQEHRQALITAAVTGELDIPGVAA